MLNLIGGEFVGAASDATLDVIEPATGAVLASVPAGETEDADRAVAAARVALPDWSTTTPAERAERLLALAAVIEQHADELAAMESRNVGKPLAAAAEELPMIVDTFRFFAGKDLSVYGLEDYTHIKHVMAKVA